jgi:hypothetical protein
MKMKDQIHALATLPPRKEPQDMRLGGFKNVSGHGEDSCQEPNCGHSNWPIKTLGSMTKYFPYAEEITGG